MQNLDRFVYEDSDLAGLTITPPAVADVSDHPIAAQKLAKTWRTLEPMWQAPAAEDKAVSRYRKILTRAFRKAKAKVAAHVRANFGKLRKDVGDDLPLDDLGDAAGDLADVSGDVADEVARGASARVGLRDKEFVDTVSARAVAQARARAAELVGKSWDEATQSYVDNPNPDMAITESTRSMIRDIISNGLDDNLGADEIAQQIEDSTGFSPERADLIAKTEITRVNSDAALSAYRDVRETGVEVKKRWIIATRDVCDDCTENSKQEPIGVDEAFQSGDQAPPLHPNCLPGDSLVLAFGVSAASKRWYDGDLAVFHTAAGKNFRSTPNHPVLTRRGWVSACEIKKGDHVISVMFGQRKTDFFNFYDQQVPTRIQDITESVFRSEQVLTVPVPTSAEDFHGDGMNGQIAVVGTNGALLRRKLASASQHAGELSFFRRRVQTLPLDGQGVLNFSVHRDCGATDRIVCGASLKSAVGLVHSGPLEEFSLASVSDSDAGLDEAPSHGGPGCAEVFGHSEFRQAAHVRVDDPFVVKVGSASAAGSSRRSHKSESATVAPRDVLVDPVVAREDAERLFGQVSADEVVFVGREPFSGQVFNLQTENHIYCANGIITHNCRCAVAPVVDGGSSSVAEPEDGDSTDNSGDGADE